jgi:hypothetical protein
MGQLDGLAARSRNDGDVVVDTSSELYGKGRAIRTPRRETGPLVVERELPFIAASNGNGPHVDRAISP